MQAKQEKLHKINLFTKVAILLAFVFISGFVAVTVWQASQNVDSMSIATSSGTPKTWDNDNSFAVAANSSVSTKLYNNQYLEFTVKVQNADSSSKAYVANFASYLSTDGADPDGFVKLSNKSLEYTYTPNDSATWRTIDVLAPGNGRNAFRLDHELELAAAGDREDAVYFRFYTVLNDQTTSSLSDKISTRLHNESGDFGYVTGSTTVAYQDLLKPTAVATTADPADNNPDSAANAYVRPLGESSFVPDVSAADTTVASIKLDNTSFLTTSIIIMVASVLIFSICLVIYLPMRHH